MRILVSTFMAMAAFSSVAAEPPKNLAGEVELGIVATSGNTETQSLKGKIAIKHNLENWKNNYQLDALYKKDEVAGVSQTTANKYFLSMQSDYKLNDKHSGLFVYASYQKDKFSGFDYQSAIALGYSDRMFGDDTSFLDYNIGPGYTFAETDDGEKAEATVLRLAADYEYKLSDTAKFTQSLSTEAAFDSDKNTRSKSETAISAKLMGNLSMKAAYTIIHNSLVPADKDKTDSTTSLTVVYLF